MMAASSGVIANSWECPPRDKPANSGISQRLETSPRTSLLISLAPFTIVPQPPHALRNLAQGYFFNQFLIQVR